MLSHLVGAIRSLPTFSSLLESLPARSAETSVAGLPGSSPAVLLAALAEALPQRVLLVVAPGPAEAERWLADLAVLSPEVARLYPQREALGEEEPHFEIAGERVETLADMLAGRARLVVTTLRATVERTRMPAAVGAARLDVARGTTLRPQDLIERLLSMGYERKPSVLDVAQFAVRGGIVDVYGFGMAGPARIEWSGDEVQSIRYFDLDSQRSEKETDSITVLPVRANDGIQADERMSGWADEKLDNQPLNRSTAHPPRQSLLDLLPSDALLIVTEGVELAEVGRIWDEAVHHLDVARRRGEDVPGRDTIYLAPETWSGAWQGFARLWLNREPADVDFHMFAPEAVERDIGRIVRLARGQPVLVLCDNEGQLERLEELIEIADPTARHSGVQVTLALGALHGGFVLKGLTVLTDHEIFRRARRLRRPRRYRQSLTAGAAGSLATGDYVVHLEHGIGIYRGITTIAVGESALEVAVLEYEGGDRLNVPLYRLDQIEPYRAAPDADSPAPRIDQLGSTRWRKQRATTERAIREMAVELLDLYARRTLAKGSAMPPDTKWQRELESSFLYEDTPDQRSATLAVKQDMERARPMDRLVVGDVGYGKTEVAIRAAFKAVQGGKQVAVLVPTTILAEQHGRTFADRMADFPVRVEVLSRFRTTREQKDVLRRLKEGVVDIVIGTHRLLSADVEFKELGLIVVDEEHRFGVKHKERLKALKLEIHVLTLTATPIPRTLHLALSGLRDLTLIETPPRDRSPVLTFVEPWDDELLEEALARELDRGGQAFLVHNRIETIESIGQRVNRLAPRARVAVAHGQMAERELDDVMRRFVAGDVDVLVSTMIVESGLDVPNANTMIVHHADQFGLAQLYQLRGRVGRGHRRAYCYLLASDHSDQAAEERLLVLEHHTELGSGYRIALRDLEIRGAGNLLGSQQSGHAHAVGYDLYLRWLNDAVKALKGEAEGVVHPPPEVSMDGAAHLADGYITDDGAKLDFYRRLARASDPGEIAILREELRDRFGPLPAEADRLLMVCELRALGAKVGLETVLVRGDEARLNFRAGAAPRLARLHAALDQVQFAAEVRRTTPLSLRLTRLGGIPIGPGLVRALATAAGGN
ncbi:MAG: transcription-repair coupling factor [Gemmatimonadetes bacterium]|nr:transcription-repair coupling factor [Gemmatimonadota bacterium]